MSKGPYNVAVKTSWAAVTAAGVLGSPVDLSNCATGNVAVQVVTSAATGTTPSMTITVQWSSDGTNWSSLDGSPETFAAITAAGSTVKQFPVKGLYMRLNATTVSGTTPSFTGSANVLVL